MKKLATILFAVPCSTEAIAQNRIGEVTGAVVDSKGNPVADATVQAVYASGPVFGMAPEAKTDENRKFTLRHVHLGDNSLFRMKEDEGYPSAFWSFYTHRQPIRVTLSSDAPNVASIRLMLEPESRCRRGTRLRRRQRRTHRGEHPPVEGG